MATDNFFRAQFAQMIDLRQPLAVFVNRVPWAQIEATLALAFVGQNLVGQAIPERDLLRAMLEITGARLSVAMLFLKHTFNLINSELVACWSGRGWKSSSGQAYYPPNLPRDATRIIGFRKAVGGAGWGGLLKALIDTAVQMKAARTAGFERVIFDTNVQEKAIAHLVDSRLREIARGKVVQMAKLEGRALRRTLAKVGRELRGEAGGFAHAKPFLRLKRVFRRQLTILGIVLREFLRKPATAETDTPMLLKRLSIWLELGGRIRIQQPKDKNKLYGLHASELECIGKGKAGKPYEFGGKSSLVATHTSGLLVDARTFAGNPYDRRIPHERLEQGGISLEDVGVVPKVIVVDLGFHSVGRDSFGDKVIPRGAVNRQQYQWLKRRQAAKPANGHLKVDHRMGRCGFASSLDDAFYAVLCAAVYNLCMAHVDGDPPGPQRISGVLGVDCRIGDVDRCQAGSCRPLGG